MDTMNTVVKIIGTVIVCVGFGYLLKPGLLRAVLAFFKKGVRLYLAAIVRFALAVVFLLAARECEMPWVITAFAVLFLISGLLIVALGLKRVKGILDWYLEQPILLLRILAVIAMAVGLIIVYAA